MVVPQVTQNPLESHGDSVRITAFLRTELARQQVIADRECRDLKRLRSLGLRSDQAERRAANAVAVAQYLGSTLRALGDNRDFKAVQR